MLHQQDFKVLLLIQGGNSIDTLSKVAPHVTAPRVGLDLECFFYDYQKGHNPM